VSWRSYWQTVNDSSTSSRSSLGKYPISLDNTSHGGDDRGTDTEARTYGNSQELR
jgi:hypothetical protein